MTGHEMDNSIKQWYKSVQVQRSDSWMWMWRSNMPNGRSEHTGLWCDLGGVGLTESVKTMLGNCV